MIERLKQAVEMLREDLERRRDLNYTEGSIGITSLLYCPLKVEYKRKYPDLKKKDIAIDDGFIFENTFEPYLEKVFNGSVVKDADIPFEIDGFKITGHPDFLIEEDGRLIILEFKAPIFVSVDGELPEEELILDTEGLIKVSEGYIKQVKFQKFIVRQYYGKEVEGYLFIKTTIQDRRRKMRKIFALKPVVEEFTEDDIRQIIREFREEKRPRYDWECKYCPYSDLCHINSLTKKIREVSKW